MADCNPIANLRYGRFGKSVLRERASLPRVPAASSELFAGQFHGKNALPREIVKKFTNSLACIGNA
jgi:hypothetical protein